MKELWGVVATVALLAAVVLFFNLRWYFAWRRTSTMLPEFGQIWISPGGRAIYITAVKNDLVVFTDTRPSVNKASQIWKWSRAEWKEFVDRERLVMSGRFQ